jgi:hypothetical protein
MSADQPAPRPSPRRHDLLVAALICLFAWLLLFFTASPIGLTYDEPIYSSRAEMAWQWLSLLARSPSAALSPSAIDQYWNARDAHPALAKLTAAITSRIVLLPLPWGVSSFTFPRTGTMFWVGLALGAMYLLLRRAGLGRALSVLGPGFLLFMPRVFGDAHLIALDAPAMATCFLAVTAAWWAVEADDRASLVLAGLAFGCAVATKVNGFFVPIVTLPYAFALKPRRAVSLLVSCAIFGPLVFFVTWPWMWHDTARRLAEYLAFHWHHWQIGVLYFGRVYNLAPWHYPLVMTAITTPVLTLLLALAAFGGWFSLLSALRKPASLRDAPPFRRLWLLAGWALVINLGPSMLPSSPKYGGVRLFLPALAWIAVLAVLGLRPVVRWARARSKLPPERAWVISAAITAAVLLPSVSMVAHFFPWELSSYNGFIGGLPGATRSGMEPTYWGETYISAAWWLDTTAPRGARIWIDPPGMESVVRMYKVFGDLRPDLVTVAGPAAFASADFAVCQNKPTEFSQEVRRLLATSPPAWTESLDGVPLIFVWRLSPAKR